MYHHTLGRDRYNKRKQDYITALRRLDKEPITVKFLEFDCEDEAFECEYIILKHLRSSPLLTNKRFSKGKSTLEKRGGISAKAIVNIPELTRLYIEQNYTKKEICCFFNIGMGSLNRIIEENSIRKLVPGFKQSATRIAKQREALKGIHWYTNGVLNKRARNCPVGFTPGRTIAK